MPCILSCLLLFFALCSSAYASESVILIVSKVPDDFFNNAIEDNSAFSHDETTCTIVGLVKIPSFSVKTINNVAFLDANSKQMQMSIESCSIYREFDDIDEFRFAVEIAKDALAAGAPRIVWGDDITANNKEVEVILIDAKHKERYRTFSWEMRSSMGDSNSQVATIEVVVDDDADKYYLWYLLPMILIFALLFIRKFYQDKSFSTTD